MSERQPIPEIPLKMAPQSAVAKVLVEGGYGGEPGDANKFGGDPDWIQDGSNNYANGLLDSVGIWTSSPGLCSPSCRNWHDAAGAPRAGQPARDSSAAATPSPKPGCTNF